ncbi:MAG: glycoside hydrolase family 15 protein [Methylotenera sp.]|nr:glycoside hydrolase family 15 protein [Oligoflexia bacterium]
MNKLKKSAVSISLLLGALLMSESVSPQWATASPATPLPDRFRREALYAQQRIAISISQPGQAKGSVMASPSKDEPNYYFHWIRDAALTMNGVFELQKNSSGAEHNRWISYLMDYIHFSRQNQLTPNRSGSPADLGLGEPKFHLNGTAFDESWGRPQNDGPALRSMVLIRLAHQLLNSGNSTDAETVKRLLYTAQIPAQTVIKADLEYVSHHWRDASYDLWEEVQGRHFYTLMMQQRALHEGAILARRLGDPEAASWYQQQSQAIRQVIPGFWSVSKNYIVATQNSSWSDQAKPSGLDIAVILASLHASPHDQSSGDLFMSVSDDRVIATAGALRQAFDSLYSVNRVQNGHQGERLAPGLGRYPEDIYDGVTNHGQGNPWFLSTQAMAEFHYKLAAQIRNARAVTLSPTKMAYFGRVSGLTSLRDGFRSGQILKSTDAGFAKLVSALNDEGDAYMNRALYHAESNGAQAEEFNRSSGFSQGAVHLTWSYVSYLSALQARSGQ